MFNSLEFNSSELKYFTGEFEEVVIEHNLLKIHTNCSEFRFGYYCDLISILAGIFRLEAVIIVGGCCSGYQEKKFGDGNVGEIKKTTFYGETEHTLDSTWFYSPPEEEKVWQVVKRVEDMDDLKTYLKLTT